MIYMLSAYFIILFCVLIVTLEFFKKKRKLPPGPSGLPIVGYYPFLGSDSVETLHKLSKKYDNVMSLNLLGHEYWILNSYEAIEEAFVTKGDIFAARARTEFNLFFIFGDGIGNAEGEAWRVQSKFIVRQLSQLGMGKSEYEVTMHTLMDNVENYIDEQNGKVNDFESVIFLYAFNVVSQLVWSKMYKHSDKDLGQIRNWMSNVFSTLEHFNLHLSGTLFRYYLKLTTNIEQRIRTNYEEFTNYVKTIVSERESHLNSNNCEDLLDFWLKECRNPNNPYINYDTVATNVAELLMDGSESTSGIIYACLYLLTLNQNVQQRMYEEIIDTLGPESSFCYSDRDRLPYTQAVIAEVQRYILLAPLASFHVSREETTLQGYQVPKRLKVLPNIYALTRNPKYFENPDAFDPNNFLDSKGQYVPNKMLLNFGIGVRKCSGFRLAEVEIFIAVTRLIRRYEFTFPTENSFDENRFNGSVRVVQRFKVSAKKR